MPIVNLKSLPAYHATGLPPKQEVASGTVFASEMAVPLETKRPALRALCIGHHQSLCTPNIAGPGTTTTPKSPLAAHQSCQRAPSKTNAPFRAFHTQCIGDHHAPCKQKTAESRTIDYPTTTIRAAARAMPPENCGPLRNSC